ncbi:MAG TPA: S8 family serine peptidase [Ktedonobacteraceae bacterium]|nr:S8 family serine peptidase [Ktedonobacteraceae bacterium]
MNMQPAWSSQFTHETIRRISLDPPVDSITWEDACEGSTGKGVKVAVIDSGIDATHPAIQGPVNGYVEIRAGDDGLVYNEEPHEDAYGHATACAGIIRAIAPECELYSIKVLGKALVGTGTIFMAGVRWAIDHDMHVCNLSLGTTKKDFFASLHELTDLAYFRRVVLVSAANNLPIPSFPSMYASVISVASHQEKEQDPYRFYYNPEPPVEFGAPGIDVRVAWQNQQWITATGNSFAAPHITGIVARILGKHPGLTPFQIKTVLRTLAANASRP